MSAEILHNAIAAIRHLLALARGKRPLRPLLEIEELVTADQRRDSNKEDSKV